MPLTNPNKIVTEERLNEYHNMILPYLGGNSMVACGGGYAPIGTVIAYMGTRAPSDFLICDGTVYNIADYTELADFFELQFGSANFFGGDGNTTFAVPDLRGEFLRGTGTNSHANQGSGANVGVHQDGTEIPSLSAYGEPYKSIEIAVGVVSKEDSEISTGSERYASNTYENTGSQFGLFTSRPTNTSVLYCIKAKSQGNGFSLDEQIVSTWIDGKPIYQKVFTGLNASLSNSSWNTVCTIPDVDLVINGWGSWNNNGTGKPNIVQFSEIEPYSNGAIKAKIYTSRTINMAVFNYTKTTD